jgi:hypothetical protein
MRAGASSSVRRLSVEMDEYAAALCVGIVPC